MEDFKFKMFKREYNLGRNQRIKQEVERDLFDEAIHIVFLLIVIMLVVGVVMSL